MGKDGIGFHVVERAKAGDLVYCIHCARVQYAMEDDPEVCVYPDCDGGFMDLIPWDEIRATMDAPENPVLGREYLMY